MDYDVMPEWVLEYNQKYVKEFLANLEKTIISPLKDIPSNAIPCGMVMNTSFNHRDVSLDGGKWDTKTKNEFKWKCAIVGKLNSTFDELLNITHTNSVRVEIYPMCDRDTPYLAHTKKIYRTSEPSNEYDTEFIVIVILYGAKEYKYFHINRLTKTCKRIDGISHKKYYVNEDDCITNPNMKRKQFIEIKKIDLRMTLMKFKEATRPSETFREKFGFKRAIPAPVPKRKVPRGIKLIRKI